MTRSLIQVGPHDAGRTMSLEEFDSAEPVAGKTYELGRGVVVVTNLPDPKHFAVVNALSRLLRAYDLSHPGLIHAIGGGGECKIVLADLASERHPDLAVYQTAAPDGPDVWASWVPEIVVEVVSPGSEHRDYVEKREEYLQFGVLEYWVVDAGRREILFLTRSGGRWVERRLGPDQEHRTRLLPGFTLATSDVLNAASPNP